MSIEMFQISWGFIWILHIFVFLVFASSVLLLPFEIKDEQNVLIRFD